MHLVITVSKNVNAEPVYPHYIPGNCPRFDDDVGNSPKCWPVDREQKKEEDQHPNHGL
ncbi:hypothetical protein DEO72_LG4g2332 [Vigna unguiculata]|uniref:Uncharacterized protein n=1 Tax=Vigna unguiculata TaxID=3917 RepID=A0A4D6LS17_VIGUN|nr:hypothetical protein DEO72_LG4g2331 [Vigna unguiculata]QCD91367.1 hypothetical protein DEO72_LG4g2332 [Vigna unguiculata]